MYSNMNSTKILDAKQKEMDHVKDQFAYFKDSVAALANAYFVLESDEDAQEYFYSNNLDYKK